MLLLMTWTPFKAVNSQGLKIHRKKWKYQHRRMSSLAWFLTHRHWVYSWDIHKHQMRIWAMQSSYRCLQSFLAALNGAQSSVCCHCSGTQLSHPSVQQWRLTTRGLNDVVYTCYISACCWSFMLSAVAVGKSGLTPALKDPYGGCG